MSSGLLAAHTAYAVATATNATVTHRHHQRMRNSAAGNCQTKNSGALASGFACAPVKRIRARASSTESRSAHCTRPAVVRIAERSVAAD